MNDEHIKLCDAFQFEYPASLLAVITNDIKFALETKNLSGLDWALNNALTERERKIILYRWKDKIAIVDICRKYNVPRERIKQIEYKGLRKLQNAKIRTIIMEGIDTVEQNKELRARLAEENAELTLKICEITQDKELINKFIETGKLTDIERERLRLLCKKRLTPNVPTFNLDDSINSLDLSVRSRNVLINAGYKHMYDLVNITRDKLMHVRNCGQKSLNEIINKLHDYGIEVP